MYRSSCKVPAITIIFKLILVLLDTFLKKYSNIKFRGNPSARNRVPCGRTDGHRLDETSSRFSQFCRVQNSLIVFPVLCQMNPVPTLPSAPGSPK